MRPALALAGMRDASLGYTHEVVGSLSVIVRGRGRRPRVGRGARRPRGRADGGVYPEAGARSGAPKDPRGTPAGPPAAGRCRRQGGRGRPRRAAGRRRCTGRGSRAGRAGRSARPSEIGVADRRLEVDLVVIGQAEGVGFVASPSRAAACAGRSTAGTPRRSAISIGVVSGRRQRAHSPASGSSARRRRGSRGSCGSGGPGL